MGAALDRLGAVRPDAYARTRNALEGQVTRLSPYITHGFLSLPDVYSAVHARHPLDAKHKFVFELGWRAFYRHVWANVGDGIHQSLHRGLLSDSAYQDAMPADVLEARTGVAAIDQAVRELYQVGYVHNHARMWLSSYLVHLRKVHWHTAAQWMLGYLLDGDVASNHLSWQWVAGTGSSKPYLFNADNVAKYAPAHWHSPGTVIDTSYETLDRMARNPEPVNYRMDARRAEAGLPQPPLLASPPAGSWSAPDPTAVAGRDVWLVHPWSLGAAAPDGHADSVVIGVGFSECHSQTPWSELRWSFVTQGLKTRTPHRWWGSVEQIAHALQGARSVAWQADAHVDGALGRLQRLVQDAPQHPVVTRHAQPALFAEVERYCESFSQWWRLTRLTP